LFFCGFYSIVTAVTNSER